MPSSHSPSQIAIPDFDQLVLYTGNVMRTAINPNACWNKKSNTELMQAIQDTLETSLFHQPSFHYFSEHKLLEVPDLRRSSRIQPEDRQDVEVTAKLFFLENQASTIETSIRHLQQLLDVESIDTFIVSFDPQQDSASIDKAWKDLEAYHHQGVISKLGLSDFDETTLEAFLQKNITVKPSIDQVHVDQCCDLPQALIRLGKQHQIEITFNSDTTDILTTAGLSSVLNKYNIHKHVKPRWVLKYNVFYNHRSVVADKGYIVMGDVIHNE
ncbi:uncharacterized protein B0P05DRAFT_585724 [Gilbertella persicaria]|uniref:uncharacterized protein n=1 Tax=Gilbertella persicaria TaxID=101096 RepID=UPI00221F5E5A|nr:uncharacterized protein B0P05DRAFT_585724 [Gilbertella persicaria]KAI8083950.1 hypothetical protein B0P05DRAFT_585724 [Gilbertella persicaria]